MILLGLSLLVVAALVLVGCGTGQAISKASGSTIAKGEYFTLNDANKKLHLYQYQGADAPTADNPKIKLKEIESGDTLTLDYIYQDYAGGIKWGAVLKVGLYQAYAGGIDESRDYYLELTGNTAMKGALDLPFKICFDSECKESKPFKTGTIKI